MEKTNESHFSFRLLTQNMWLTCTSLKYIPAKRERTQSLLFYIDNYDIVTLQEVFKFKDNGWTWVDNSLRDLIKSECAKKGFLHFVEPQEPQTLGCQDSGLLIASRFPIVEQHEHIFQNYSWLEAMNNKGVLHAAVQVPISPKTTNVSPSLDYPQNETTHLKQYEIVHVITTHLDAHNNGVKHAQLKELQSCIKNWILDAKQTPPTSQQTSSSSSSLALSSSSSSSPPLIVLTGDFNIDSLGKLYAGGGTNYADMLKEDLQHQFLDVFTDNTSQHPVTYPGYDMCIDHILLNKTAVTQKNIQYPFVVEKFKSVDKQSVDPNKRNYISDHFGVSVHIQGEIL